MSKTISVFPLWLYLQTSSMPCPSDGLTADLDHPQREALHLNVRCPQLGLFHHVTVSKNWNWKSIYHINIIDNGQGWFCLWTPSWLLCGEGRITASSMQKTFCTAGILQVRRKKNNNRKFSSLVINRVAHKLEGRGFNSWSLQSTCRCVRGHNTWHLLLTDGLCSSSHECGWFPRLSGSASHPLHHYMNGVSAICSVKCFDWSVDSKSAS